MIAGTENRHDQDQQTRHADHQGAATGDLPAGGDEFYELENAVLQLGERVVAAVQKHEGAVDVRGRDTRILDAFSELTCTLGELSGALRASMLSGDGERRRDRDEAGD